MTFKYPFRKSWNIAERSLYFFRSGKGFPNLTKNWESRFIFPNSLQSSLDWRDALKIRVFNYFVYLCSIKSTVIFVLLVACFLVCLYSLYIYIFPFLWNKLYVLYLSDLLKQCHLTADEMLANSSVFLEPSSLQENGFCIFMSRFIVNSRFIIYQWRSVFLPNLFWTQKLRKLRIGQGKPRNIFFMNILRRV